MTKPPYRVPLMAEIARLRWNGLTVVSTFSGYGGSCLGFRMAGYRVLWASEFVPEAQASYRANMRRGTIVDGRDIRGVKASEILAAVKMKPGEIDVFEGSPPCQAFSMAGAREKGWGTDRAYKHGAKQRNEELFFDYVRLRDGLMPRAFVAENVSGLVKGTAKGFFLEILRELKRGYRVEARLLDAQWLGVPQRRQRVIFVGVREDLRLDPAFPDPLPYRYSVRDALPWIVSQATSVRRGGEGGFKAGGEMRSTLAPSPTIGASPASGNNRMPPSLVEAVVYDTGRKGAKARNILDEPCPTITAGPDDPAEGGGPRNHFTVEAETSIDGFAIGEEYDKIDPNIRGGKYGAQSERFFQLRKPHPADPSFAITADGGKPGVAGVVHPTERRKFSIAELRRICGAPDDVVLTGTYAQQWERLGNSVPPVMMFHVAEALRDRVLLPARARGTSKAKRSARGKPRGASPPATAAASSRARRRRRPGEAAPTDAG